MSAAASQWHVAVADVNGDGRLDLLTANGGANTVSVLLNQSVPALKIAPAGNAIHISWPDWAGYQLESSTNLAPSLDEPGQLASRCQRPDYCDKPVQRETGVLSLEAPVN